MNISIQSIIENLNAMLSADPEFSTQVFIQTSVQLPKGDALHEKIPYEVVNGNRFANVIGLLNAALGQRHDGESHMSFRRVKPDVISDFIETPTLSDELSKDKPLDLQFSEYKEGQRYKDGSYIVLTRSGESIIQYMIEIDGGHMMWPGFQDEPEKEIIKISRRIMPLYIDEDGDDFYSMKSRKKREE